MPVHIIDSAIFRDLYSNEAMRAVFDEQAQVRAWLQTEAALARAQATSGLIPADAADCITRACDGLDIDLDELRRGTSLVGYPILPLVRQIARACDDAAGGFVHWGATTQDIMDSGTILQLKQARALIMADLDQLIDAAASLARRHRDTPMAGRTHGQQAAPITFGFKVAGWIAELQRDRERLEQCAPRVLPLQLSGAVGTLAAIGPTGLAVQEHMARDLGLAVPVTSWHAARDGLGEFACHLGILSASLARIAQEVALLQKNETAELEEGFEPGRGGSSTMPQKRNPIACEAIVGIGKIVRQDVAIMLDAMTPDHERATGPWHAEWEALPEICVLTHAALRHAVDLLRGLVVRPERMAANLVLTNGLIVSEAVMMRLAPALGRQRAHDVVYEACMAGLEHGRPLREQLLATAEVMGVISEQELDELLAPERYVGLSTTFVDRVLAGL